VYYNITITGLSVVVAFVIGTIELLSVLQGQLNLSGGIWSFFAKFDINHAGFIIVGVFAATWAIALAVWKFARVEARWEQNAAEARAAQSGAEL
jgi:high-affinity nickel-transport protein